MREGLTPRQTQILKALIDEYIKTTEPVGSLALERKYSFGVSPATIRNEMVNLTKKGYLRQPHTSAGRVPTPTAMKFYINRLMEEKQMSLAEEVKAKEDVRIARNDVDKLIKEATRALAHRTRCFAIATTSDGGVWSHGHANVFKSPIFFDFQICQSLFSLLDEGGRIQELFFERLTGSSPIEVLFGEELGWEYFEPIGVVATRFRGKDCEGALGVFGPYGLDYQRIIPTVRYFGDLIGEMLS